jgi:hypothetical protein
MIAFTTRLTKLEQFGDAARPRVALVFFDSPDGTPVRLFNSVGAELPADTQWESQVPAAKVFVGIKPDDI